MAAFGKVVGSVLDPWGPVDEKLTLGTTVADPVVAHVNHFGAALFDGVIGNAIDRAVVSMTNLVLQRHVTPQKTRLRVLDDIILIVARRTYFGR